MGGALQSAGGRRARVPKEASAQVAGVSSHLECPELDLISIIMPAYNSAATITQAMDSLRAQDYPYFELIVVDDGSADETAALVNRYTTADSRIRLLCQEHASAGAARNTGLAQARGTYVLFLDADDVFEPSLLSCLYAAALATGADISMCNADCFVDDPACPVRPWGAGTGELAPGFYHAQDLRGRLFQSTTMVVWNKLFKTDVIRGLNLQFQDQARFNDAYFTIMALSHARTICKLEDVLVHYRIAQGTSLVDREIDQPFCDLRAFEAARAALAESGLLEGPLRVSFDNLCVNTIAWRLAHYARRSSAATEALFNAYFGNYAHAWGLANCTWPYVRSPRYALEHALMQRAGVEGLMRAAAPDTRNRTSQRDAVAELAFAARLAREALFRKMKGGLHGNAR